MARTLAQLKKECEKNGLNVVQSGREAKGPYESALRNFYWDRDFPGQTMPPQLHPMLARNIKDVDPTIAEMMWRDDSDFAAQLKVDGCRLLQCIIETGSRFTSRRLSDRTYRYNENTAQVPHLNKITHPALIGTVLDGEVVCPRPDVNTGAVITKNALQATVALLAIDPKESERIQREQNAWLRFKVFDILQWKGADVKHLPYEKRLAFLNMAMTVLQETGQADHIDLVPAYRAAKKEYYESVVKDGYEGIMLKDLRAPYEASSSRTKAMFKVKRFEEYDTFVTGFVPPDPDKGWSQLIGGLECSAYDISFDGTECPLSRIHIVAVPINMTLEQRIDATACKNCQAGVKAITENVVGKRVVQSVKCEACEREMTSDSIMLNPTWLGKVFIVRGQEFTPRVLRLKHAVIMSERFDKDPSECTIDVAAISAKFDAKGEETGVRL